MPISADGVDNTRLQKCDDPGSLNGNVLYSERKGMERRRKQEAKPEAKQEERPVCKRNVLVLVHSAVWQHGLSCPCGAAQFNTPNSRVTEKPITLARPAAVEIKSVGR